MITIIHGNDIVSSRNFFIELKSRAKEPVSFQTASITITDLAQVLTGGGIFGNEMTIFIEYLLSQRKKATHADSIIEYLLENHNAGNIVLWEEKEIPGTTLKRFTNAKVEMFRIPQLVFTFLDSLAPGAGPRLVTMLGKTLATSEIELVFYLLVRQFRLLLAMTNDQSALIDEAKRLAPWQKSKLKQQAFRFTQEALIEKYNKLYAIEVGQKTGALSAPLRISIDFFLLGL